MLGYLKKLLKSDAESHQSRQQQCKHEFSLPDEAIPLCAECQRLGVLTALRGGVPPGASSVTGRKGGTPTYYLSFPSVPAAVERSRQGSCVVCRFVVSMLPREASLCETEEWRRDRGYTLWLRGPTYYDDERRRQKKGAWHDWYNSRGQGTGSPGDGKIRSLTSLKLSLPSIGMGAHVRLLQAPAEGAWDHEKAVDAVAQDEDAKDERAQAILGGMMRGQMRFGHIKQFLAVCEKEHPECRVDWQGLPPTDLDGKLLLVDTAESCLIVATMSERYVALSYVWGDVKQFLCTRDVLEQLKQPGGLLDHWKHVPKTITDAMQLVRSIGERYLWVDTLCIVQDDVEDKMYQISKMDRIFSAAILTICAVGGRDANAGLPGVFPGTRPLGVHPISPTLALAADPCRREEHLTYSAYESRGWTLQERALARRCLYVMDAMVLVSCRRWCADEHQLDWFTARREEEEREDIRLEHSMTDFSPLYGLNRALRWGHDPELETARAYTRLAQLYVKRKLTYSTDVVNAFTGIAARMEEFVPGKSICAMPSGLLHFLLMWVMTNDDYIDDSKPQLERNEDFPTWAWAGWVGQIAYDNAEAVLDMLAYYDGYAVKKEYDFLLPGENQAAAASVDLCPNMPSAAPLSSPSVCPRPACHVLHLHAPVVDAGRFAFTAYTCPEPERSGQPWRWYRNCSGAVWRANMHEQPLPATAPRAKGAKQDGSGRLCGMLLDGPADPSVLSSRFSFVLLSRARTPGRSEARRASLHVDRPRSQGGDGWVNPMLELHSEAKKWCRPRADQEGVEILSVLLVRWREDGWAERAGVAFLAAEAWDGAGAVKRCVRVV